MKIIQSISVLHSSSKMHAKLFKATFRLILIHVSKLNKINRFTTKRIFNFLFHKQASYANLKSEQNILQQASIQTMLPDWGQFKFRLQPQLKYSNFKFRILAI